MHPAIKTYFSTYHLDAVLITDLVNVRYLAGFVGTNGMLLITRAERYLLTDFRYLAQAKTQAPGWKIVNMGANLTTTLRGLLKKTHSKKLGFEAGRLSYAYFTGLKKGLSGSTLIPIYEDPAQMRIVKNEPEIKKIRKALQINRLAFTTVRPRIKPGMTESRVALLLEFALRERGAEKLAFDTIVATGTRGSLPHGLASQKKLRKNELVTIDFGGLYQGYHADETVTFCLGKPDAKQTKIYQIVRSAQQAAIKIARPGAKCSDLDKAARDYISAQGFGKYFGHALGHGVGLEIHDLPTLSPNSKDILKPGMVITIEPGIYIPGWGGVRIEDVFVCTANGLKQLTQINKALV